MKLMISLGLFAMLGALAACDDDPSPVSDAGIDVIDDTGDMGEDPDDDVEDDAVGEDLTEDVLDEDLPAFDTNETENNGFETPESITLPHTVRGIIGEPIYDSIEEYYVPDDDVFEFTATAGTVIRLEFLQENIDIHCIVITGENGGIPIYRLLDDETAGLTRQVYIPEDGTYQIAVRDWTNILYLYGEADPVGGNAYYYELQITEEAGQAMSDAVTLTMAAPTDNVSQTELPAGNGVEIYSLTTTDAGLLIINVDAQTLATPADVDGAIVLMSADETTFIAENDDENYDGGLYDPLLRLETTAAATYKLVFDFYLAGADNAHDIHFTLADPSVELEPNDDTASAWPLTITAAGASTSDVSATIGAPVEGGVGEDDIPDLDWFALGPLEEGDAVEITVTPGATSELQPRLFVGIVVDGFFGPEFATIYSGMPNSDDIARIEATAIFDGEFYAVVADQRNFTPPDADDSFVLDAVGGPTYDYTIGAVEFTRTIDDLGAQPITDHDAQLDETGEVDWFSFSTGATDEGLLLVGLSAEDFMPTTMLFNSTAAGTADAPPVGEFLDFSDQYIILGNVEPSNEFQLAVFNELEWPAIPSTMDYQIDVSVVNPTPTAESGDFPDTGQTPTTVTQAVSAYEGEVTGESTTVFDTDIWAIELGAGERLFAETYDPVVVGTNPADTILELSGGGLTDPVVNDDYSGLLSRIVYDLPSDATTATYTLTVRPYCSSSGSGCSGGPYGLTILVLGD